MLYKENTCTLLCHSDPRRRRLRNIKFITSLEIRFVHDVVGAERKYLAHSCAMVIFFISYSSVILAMRLINLANIL